MNENGSLDIRLWCDGCKGVLDPETAPMICLECYKQIERAAEKWEVVKHQFDEDMDSDDIVELINIWANKEEEDYINWEKLEIIKEYCKWLGKEGVEGRVALPAIAVKDEIVKILESKTG